MYFERRNLNLQYGNTCVGGGGGGGGGNPLQGEWSGTGSYV